MASSERIERIGFVGVGRMGRPMAILRMGSRVPENIGSEGIPGIGSPPVEIYDLPEMSEPVMAPPPIDQAIERQVHPTPRTSVERPPRQAPQFRNRYPR